MQFQYNRWIQLKFHTMKNRSGPHMEGFIAEIQQVFSLSIDIQYVTCYKVTFIQIIQCLSLKSGTLSDHPCPWLPLLVVDKFSWAFQVFFCHLPVFLKCLFNKFTPSEKKKFKKNWLKFPHFSSILGKISWLLQYVKNSLTGKCSYIFQVFQSMWEPWCHLFSYQI